MRLKMESEENAKKSTGRKEAIAEDEHAEALRLRAAPERDREFIGLFAKKNNKHKAESEKNENTVNRTRQKCKGEGEQKKESTYLRTYVVTTSRGKYMRHVDCTCLTSLAKIARTELLSADCARVCASDSVSERMHTRVCVQMD